MNTSARMLLAAALLAAGTAGADSINMNVNITVPDGAAAAPAARREREPERPRLREMQAQLGDGVILLQDGRRIALDYRKDQLPWPTIEVLEPVGARVTLLKGEHVLCQDEAPFICKKAGIDDYVKMVVEEADRRWAVKFQAKKGRVLTVGRKGQRRPERREAPAAGLRSKHFVLERAAYRVGDAVNIRFVGMPGSQTDWVTVVPAGAAPDTWGQWKYTDGAAEGTLSASGLQPGRYEARAYYNYPHTEGIQDRIGFTVQ